jgi:hypothetical protein
MSSLSIYIISLPIAAVLYLAFSALKLYPPCNSSGLMPSRNPPTNRLSRKERWEYCQALAIVIFFALAAATIVITSAFLIIKRGPTAMAATWIIISGFAISMWFINRDTNSPYYWFYLFAGIAVLGAALYLVWNVFS